MANAQLKVLLSSGSSPIVFDARPSANETAATPFFKNGLLKNAMLLKTGEGQAGLQTKLFLPFDSNRATRGGVSMVCQPSMSQQDLEAFFGTQLDGEAIKSDIRKFEVLAKTPSFSPFLLRDAFERSGVEADVRYFQVSDSEVAELKQILKGKLKPLAAMALPSAGSGVGNEKLDVLVTKLWELNDAGFLAPFAQALKIPKGETTEVLYGWIGVSYFNREFSKRQVALRALAEWLVAKRPVSGGGREDNAAQYEFDLRIVRERVRAAWSAAGEIFGRFNSSYDRLIQDSDAALFVEYLKGARRDFLSLGAHLAFIEQSLCIFNAILIERPGSQLSLDLLHDLALSMRGAAIDGISGQAAA